MSHWITYGFTASENTRGFGRAQWAKQQGRPGVRFLAWQHHTFRKEQDHLSANIHTTFMHHFSDLYHNILHKGHFVITKVIVRLPYLTIILYLIKYKAVKWLHKVTWLANSRCRIRPHVLSAYTQCPIHVDISFIFIANTEEILIFALIFFLSWICTIFFPCSGSQQLGCIQNSHLKLHKNVLIGS